MGKLAFFLFFLTFFLSCNPKTENLGNDLELLRIQTLKNADAYENILEFNQSFDFWNTVQTKAKADSFFLKLSQDYKLSLSEENLLQNISLLSKDSLFLEIENPLMKNKKIEIPFINFHIKAQETDVQSTLIYFKKFDLEDFQIKRKKIIGKILVIELNENQFDEYIEKSKISGILGLIIIVKEGNQVPCYQFSGNYKIPVLGLSQDDGFFLIESLKKYPKQFVRILLKQSFELKKGKIWKWEKNLGKSQKIVIISNWKSNACNKAILSNVTPSLILLDLAKTFQNFDWASKYNLVFLWTDGNHANFDKNPNDIYIHLEKLTDFMGWYYPEKDQKKWNFIEKYLKIYENRLEMKSFHQMISKPIIPKELLKIMNTDSEGIEWMHKDMILHSLGMVALTVYLLSIS